MRVDQIAAAAMGPLVARLLRRALLAATMVLFALIALYQFTVAGTLALEIQYGALNAHLIVAGIYLVAALAAFAAFRMMRAKPLAEGTPAVNQVRDMQLIMLVEAAMLGYSLARKSDRAQ